MIKHSSSNKSTSVLIVLYYYYPYVSGLTIYAQRLAEGLVSAGYDVTVLTSRYDRSLSKREVINGVSIIRRPVLINLGKGVIMPTFWLDMARFARKYDYVNPHLPMADSGLASLLIPRKKIITTYHCDINLGEGLLSSFIEGISMALMRLQLTRSSAVVTQTIDYMEHSKMNKFLPKAKQIYPPISDLEFISGNPTSLFKKLGLSKDETKIGFVGRVVYEKGIDYLLESIPELKKSFKKFKIIIVGDYQKVVGGSVKEKLDHFLKKYPENILFTGYISDEERNLFYSGLDVLVLPSIDPLEAFGIVQVEAMLCGAPVVASNLPGVREVIKKTGYGLLSQPKNSKDIAHKIISVVSNREEYKPNRSRIVSSFGYRKSIDRYIELLPKTH